MNGWNYRIIFHPASAVKMTSGKEMPSTAYYGLHEVHYKGKKPRAYTVDPIIVVEVLEKEWDLNGVYDEFKRILASMRRGISEPILEEDDFRAITKDDDG
jgi:hypothetical protein